MPDRHKGVRPGWWFTPDLINRLRVLAKQRGHTLTAEAAEAITDHLARHERKGTP
jgi:plasmid stability protein